MITLNNNNAKTDEYAYSENSKTAVKVKVKCLPENNPAAASANLNSESLVQGFILSEILGKPKAKMWRGNAKWSSRFW